MVSERNLPALAVLTHADIHGNYRGRLPRNCAVRWPRQVSHRVVEVDVFSRQTELVCDVRRKRSDPIALGRVVAGGKKVYTGLAGHMGRGLGHLAGNIRVDASGNRRLEMVLRSRAAGCGRC